MNNFMTRIMTILAIVSANSGLNAMNEPYNIYIENHYGTPIKFKMAQPKTNASETSVANLQRTLVGRGFDIANLSIRTTGAGSSYFSSFTDLAKELTQIRDQAFLIDNQGKNAIILIKPSRSYQGWDIAINWEGNGKIEEMPAEEQIITQIMNGYFGPHYAQKVTDISTYPYWKVEEQGLTNLNDLLYGFARKFTLEKNQLEFKKTIDDIYNTLEGYKKRYNWVNSKEVK